MISKISRATIDFIAKGNNFTQEQIEEMEYTLKIFTYEIIKSILILVFFTAFGYGKQTVIIILAMSLTKPFIGGYHESSQIRCFVATTLVILFIIILYATNKLSVISILVLSILNIFCVYHRAPIINEQMPIKKEELIKKNRRIGMRNTTILVILSNISFNYWWSSIIIWTITLQTMLMFSKRV